MRKGLWSWGQALACITTQDHVWRVENPDNAGILVARDPRKGKPVWKHELEGQGHAEAWVDGALILRLDVGLVCFG